MIWLNKFATNVERRSRMSKLKRLIILIAVIIAMVSTLALQRNGWCLGCLWTGDCYSDNICGNRCICVKRDTLDLTGYCAVK